MLHLLTHMTFSHINRSDVSSQNSGMFPCVNILNTCSQDIFKWALFPCVSSHDTHRIIIIITFKEQQSSVNLWLDLKLMFKVKVQSSSPKFKLKLKKPLKKTL